tara:strand:+ start:884 stop:1435 length:552 start_codon:yes stop_codon:yes gene_type:complete
MIFSQPFYHIFKVKDHLLKKEEILFRISKHQKSYSSDDIKFEESGYTSFISNTDWDDDHKGYHHTWFDIAFSERDKLNYKKFIRRVFNKDPDVHNSWFNQYYESSGSEHHFHFHDDCPCANVYYVELEDKSLRTILRHPVTGKEVVPRVNEGDVLVFNGKIWHRSPRNFTNTRKTIVAFNLQF